MTFDKDDTRIYGSDTNQDYQILTDATGRIIVVLGDIAGAATEVTLASILSQVTAAAADIASLLDEADTVWTPYMGSTSGLVQAVPSNVLTHTNTSGSNERIRRVAVSADRATTFTITIGGTLRYRLRTVSDSPNQELDLGNGIVLADAAAITIDAENESDQGTSSADATILVSP